MMSSKRLFQITSINGAYARAILGEVKTLIHSELAKADLARSDAELPAFLERLGEVIHDGMVEIYDTPNKDKVAIVLTNSRMNIGGKSMAIIAVANSETDLEAPEPTMNATP